MPGVELSSALGDVRGYEFGNYDEVFCCVMCCSWEVWGEGGMVFFLAYVESWGNGKKRSFAMMRVWWLRKSRSILPQARALVVVDVELGTRPWGWR